MMTKWISVEDKWPEYNTIVLFYDEETDSIERGFLKKYEKCYVWVSSIICIEEGHLEYFSVTHWMPLPDKPKDE